MSSLALELMGHGPLDSSENKLKAMANHILDIKGQLSKQEEKIKALREHNKEHESGVVIIIGLLCGLMLILGCIFLIVDMYIPEKKTDKDPVTGVETTTSEAKDLSWAIQGGNYLVFLSSLGFILTFLIHAIKRLMAAAHMEKKLTAIQVAKTVFYDKGAEDLYSEVSTPLNRNGSVRFDVPTTTPAVSRQNSNEDIPVVFHEVPRVSNPLAKGPSSMEVVPIELPSLRNPTPTLPVTTPSVTTTATNPVVTVTTTPVTTDTTSKSLPTTSSGLYNRFNYAGHSRAGYAPLNRNYY